jgi:hypothetical protein
MAPTSACPVVGLFLYSVNTEALLLLTIPAVRPALGSTTPQHHVLQASRAVPPD